MGNRCLNYLTVTGERSQLLKFDKCFKENGIEFKVEKNHLTDTGFTNFDFSNYLCYWHEKLTSGYKLLGLISVDQKKDYSFSAFIPPSISYFRIWDDWKFLKWSTRSDLDEMIVNWIDNGSVKYQFKTDWDPPMPVIVQMILDFKMLDFEFKYVEDCQSYAGVVRSKDGEIIEEVFSNVNPGGIRPLLEREFGYDFIKCPSCSELLQEHEADANKCPFCHTRIAFNDEDELIVAEECDTEDLEDSEVLFDFDLTDSFSGVLDFDIGIDIDGGV